MNPKNMAKKAVFFIETSTNLLELRIFAFSLTAVIAFPLYYYIWHDLFPQAYENLTLRMIGCAIFLPLVFVRRWSKWMNQYKNIYWYLATLYGLPFFFTFMLLKNNGSTVWLLSTLIAIFLMILLLDWLHLLVQLVLGVSLAWLSYNLTTDVVNVSFLTFESIPIYLFAIILGGILNYSSEIIQKQRLRAMLATASSIAHELRTPLLSIKSGAKGLQLYLPRLLNAYQLAKEQGLKVEPIRLAHLNGMYHTLERIESETHHSNTVIDMLLVNIRNNDVQKDSLNICSIVQCIDSALERYPFTSIEERELVTWSHEGDFKFNGIDLLMVHVLFNLIKNALFHISKAGKGNISIQIQSTVQGNMLIFRDSGDGIPAEFLSHMFTRFYSRTANSSSFGTGIGLAFCKSIMDSFGGTINCTSLDGEYTEFTLIFPVLHKALL